MTQVLTMHIVVGGNDRAYTSPVHSTISGFKKRSKGVVGCCWWGYTKSHLQTALAAWRTFNDLNADHLRFSRRVVPAL